jgi:hypothetical protein
VRFRRGNIRNNQNPSFSAKHYLLHGVAPFIIATVGLTEGFKWLRENKISLGDARIVWYALAGSCLGVYLGWHYGASALMSRWFQVYATRWLVPPNLIGQISEIFRGAFTGWPTWILSGISHISLLHMAVNMFVGHSFIQGFNKVKED